VLFWGILGALIMRGIFIAVGATLLARFHWIIYIFGGFLFFTGFKMAVQEESEPDPESNPLIRFVRRFFPCTEGYEGEQFFVRRSGVLYATPLLLVLIMVETTDLVFALDSIPAIFAVTRDPFIVYTSNVFASLGLRALYFLLAGVLGMFHYLQQGLAAILMFVGVKMLLLEVYKIPTVVSLGVIFGILTISIVASMIRRSRLQDDPGLVSGEGCQLNRDNCGISISGKCRVDRKVSSAETDTSDGLDRDRSRPAAGDGAE
jgi:tellurite resistance protein TerC